MVSGHRRMGVAIALSMKTIPAIVRSYKNAEECELDFLICNIQREKTLAQKVNEFKRYKQILSQIGKTKQGSGKRDDVIIFQDEFLRSLENLNIEHEKPLDTIQVIAQATGFTEHFQNRINIICGDEYRDKKLNVLRGTYRGLFKKELPTEAEYEIINYWKIVEDKYREGQMTMNSAADAVTFNIKTLISNWEKQAGKGKADKPVKEVVKKEKEQRYVLKAITEQYMEDHYGYKKVMFKTQSMAKVILVDDNIVINKGDEYMLLDIDELLKQRVAV